MITYSIKRILTSIPIIFGLATMVFLITRLLPGDPTLLFISPNIPPSVAAQLRTEFGLDQPIVVQYFHWLAGIASGNLGYSFTYQRSVVEVVSSAFLNTAVLAGTAITIELIVGIVLGVAAVRFRRTAAEKMISYGGLVLYTMPAFWVATILLLFFSQFLGLFPSSHMHSINADRMGGFEYSFDLMKHLFLPSLTLALPGAAGLARFVHAQLLSTLNQQYIITAKSFGLSDRQVMMKYALPNALVPVITLIGLEIGGLLSGALVTETIFAWPGIGRIAVTAIFARDYPLILGCTILTGFVVIAGNLIADVLYSTVDPRMKVKK